MIERSQGFKDFAARFVKRFWPDLVICALLAASVGWASYHFSGQLAQRLNEDDVWFDSDPRRVFREMSGAGKTHDRTQVHPLFILFSQPIVASLHAGTSLSLLQAARLLNALWAGGWLILVFCFLRTLGCRRWDATLFTILAVVSASAMFWLSVLETYLLGSISILVALISAGVVSRWKRPALWMAVVSACTLSITVTNWMAGLFATAVSFPIKRALLVTGSAFCIVLMSWGLQKFAYPSCKFFLGNWTEGQFINHPVAGGPIPSMRAFIFHTVVMPNVSWKNVPEYRVPYLSVQSGSLSSGSSLQIASRAAWVFLLGTGVWGLFSFNGQLELRIVLGGTLAGQMALHSIYGLETFMYSLNWLPLLIALAALGTLTRLRLAVLTITTVLIVTAAANNVSQFSIAMKSLSERRALKASVPGE